MEIKLTYISWADFKTLHARDKFVLWEVVRANYLPAASPTGGYDVYGWNGRILAVAKIKTEADRTEYEDTNGVYQPNATTATGLDEIFTLLPCLPTNVDGAPIFEQGEALGTPTGSNLTILSHDFSDPTTWYQQATQVTEEELADQGAGVWKPNPVHPLWINEDHPNLFADELFNGTGYNKLWKTDGTYYVMGHFRPVIEVQPGGTGPWQVADPADTASSPTPNYSYRIHYEDGAVHFKQIGDWTAGTKVRASYFYAQETQLGSTFEVGPAAGVHWYIPYTEVQLSKGAQWNDTVMLYGTQGGFEGQRFRYKSTRNMQCTASSPGWTVDGKTATPAAYPPSEDNGWPEPATRYDGYRNSSAEMEITPWKYLLSKNLEGNLAQTMKCNFLNGQKFTATDLAIFTFYVKVT